MQIGCQCKNFRPYGSAWHLLRFLGYHRAELDKQVLKATGAKVLEWLDFPYAAGSRAQPTAKPAGIDSEWEGLSFLQVTSPRVFAKWNSTWPTSGSQQCWDAIARLETSEGQSEWLLVEAKARLEESKKGTDAKENGGLPKIRNNLEALKAKLGIPAAHDWLNPYYQYANRLFVLDFLLSQGVPARLLHVCFLGDTHSGKKCPKTPKDWEDEFKKIYSHLGLKDGMKLLDHVHRLYLSIHP